MLHSRENERTSRRCFCLAVLLRFSFTPSCFVNGLNGLEFSNVPYIQVFPFKLLNSVQVCVSKRQTFQMGQLLNICRLQTVLQANSFVYWTEAGGTGFLYCVAEVYASTVLKPLLDSQTTRNNQDVHSLRNSKHGSRVIEVCIMHEVVGCPDYKQRGPYDAARLLRIISQISLTPLSNGNFR